MQAVVVLLAGCADFVLTAHRTAEDSGEPAVGTAAIEVDPTGIDFGTLVVGSAEVREVVVRNHGDGNLSLVEPQRDGDDAFTLGELGTTTVAPGAETSFSVRFEPPEAASFSATVGVLSNDPDAGVVEVELTGAGGEGG